MRPPNTRGMPGERGGRVEGARRGRGGGDGGLDGLPGGVPPKCHERAAEPGAQPRGGRGPAAPQARCPGVSQADGLPAPSCLRLPRPRPWCASAVVCLEVLSVGLI